MDFFELYQNHIAAFFLVLSRTSGLFMVAPFFGSMNIPVNMRAGVAFAIAALIFPVSGGAEGVAAPTSLIGYAATLLGEMFIGWLIGFVAFVALSAINMAGKIMDMQVGFAIVNVMDPTSGQQIPLIGSFLYNLTIIIFLVTNSHHMLLAAVAESFNIIPLMGVTANPSLTDLMIDFTTGIFVTGMKIAIPVTFAELMTNVSLGILARTMPQLNIFVVGIPMHIMIGLFIIGILMPFYVFFLDVVFNEIYGDISIVLRNLAGGST